MAKPIQYCKVKTTTTTTSTAKKKKEELYKKGVNNLGNHNGVVIYLEPDILEV